jgi:L-ascorbate metabolism protein UlaG (beta-lactamase superfamily)
MKLFIKLSIFTVAVSVVFSLNAYSQNVRITPNVKITPLGSHDGEFCSRDRAMLFEDPDGTRLLFDVGRTVAGPDDPRLGKIDVVLLSGMHGDHMGDKRISKVGNGTCAKPQTEVAMTPNSNTAAIIVGKNAQAFLGGEMHKFMQTKVKAAGGDPKQVGVLRFGGERQVGGVKIAIVPVTHSNGIGRSFLDKALGDTLGHNGLTAYAGPDNGYILSFSNGLVVYLSGDSGITAEQDVTVRGFYGAKLAIINAGGLYTSGPKEAAYSITQLVQPNSVIPHHMNEEATEKGVVKPGSKTAIFQSLIKDIPVHIPVSGTTMEFDGEGLCLKGC